MPFPKIYTDEDVDPLLAHVLTEKGFDAVSSHKSKMNGKTDEEQLAFATKNKRAILTHNIRDFCILAKSWHDTQKLHEGIILAPQVPFSTLLQATIKTLGSHISDSLTHRVIWLKTKSKPIL